jgi:hypothetical protein
MPAPKKFTFHNKYQFPGLQPGNHNVTSEDTDSSNCIAWAADDDKNWWWPTPPSYWPAGANREVTLHAFIEAFSILGYSVCENGVFEEGFEKVAIYMKNNKPSHMAKQISKTRWKSKMGDDADIEHTLIGICGDAYGNFAKFLKRPIRQP